MNDSHRSSGMVDRPADQSWRNTIVRVKHSARGAFTSAVEAVFPQVCQFCGTPDVADGDPLCAACVAAVQGQMNEPYCPRCGQTLPPYGLRQSGCGKCASERLPYDRVIRVGSYTNAFASLVRLFKFGGREQLAGYLADELARRIMRSEVYEELDMMTAVPTCWRHRLRRPFHPAVVVGRRVARRCGIPYRRLLKRVGGGPSQIGLHVVARRENVRGKFRARCERSIAGAVVCLIDDVSTSGATAAECARVLKRAGAKSVCVAVLARAGDDHATLMAV